MKIKSRIFILFFIIIISFQSFAFANTPSLNSESAILVEVSTGRILYEKNSTKKLFPASTTKALTAILVIENCNLSDMVTVTQSALNNIPSGYVTCNLQVGEKLSVNDLLYALMLPSANDAAYVLAEHVSGSVDNFSNLMNAKALELGCKTTHFVNPNGIHNSAHYSSAYDLYLIANYAMKNDAFRKIVSTTEYTLPATDKYPSADRVLKTTNALLDEESSNYYKYAIGVKTGYTSKAGNCLISQSSRDGLDFIAVVLNGDSTSSRFVDSKKLFNYGYDNFTLTKLIEKNSFVQNIEVKNATKETKSLDLIIDESITIVNNKNIDINDVVPEITLVDNIEAPISAGQKLGSIKYKVDDIEYSANLLAESDVDKINYNSYFIVLGLIILFVAFRLLKSSRRNKSNNKFKNKYKTRIKRNF